MTSSKVKRGSPWWPCVFLRRTLTSESHAIYIYIPSRAENTQTTPKVKGSIMIRTVITVAPNYRECNRTSLCPFFLFFFFSPSLCLFFVFVGVMAIEETTDKKRPPNQKVVQVIWKEGWSLEIGLFTQKREQKRWFWWVTHSSVS